ncbi:MAG: hypothetical protein N838_08910 [Thiohalocapsa sp. PB-PSB1]|jgi:NADPH-dependent curcumin reductase CurA|nr:MAG: hypothetical protein N838_08910 [Thiohalocapsa sp. PB-PSB1]
MSDSEWHKQGGTLSHKNACKEFGFTEDEIINAMKDGKIQYRQNWAHGNPYFRVLRSEVQSLAQERHGSKGMQRQKIEFELQKINKEINSHKRKIKALERQKLDLIKKQEQEDN